MAAFKEHCAFGFWKEALIFDRAKTAEKTTMGSFGCSADAGSSGGGALLGS